jgi:hypothetical protein
VTDAVADRRETRRVGRLLLAGLPLFGFVVDVALLAGTYVAVGAIAPGALGAVGASPFAFAAAVVAVKLPMTLAHMLLASRRAWVAMLARGEFPARQGRRRGLVVLRDQAVDAATWVVAALIVFHGADDLGGAPVWRLTLMTAAGPVLLPKLISGAVRLAARRWRRRVRYRARHGDEPPEPDGPT